MPKIVLALVAILTLAAGGAGAYFYFEQPAQASVGDDENHKDAKEAKSEKHDEHAKGSEFVELDPLILPIIDSSGVSQVVSIIVVLEVDSAKKAEKAKHMSPRLKDAYIQDMYGVLNKHAALEGGVIKVDRIKSRLNKVSHKVLGDDVVQDVLLKVVQQRPI